MAIPHWASKLLETRHLQEIQEALENAESKTSGEIVPMIVRRSSTIGHVPPLVFCLLTILFFVFDVPTLQSDFFGDNFLHYVFDALLLFGLTAVFSRLNFVERWLTAKEDQIDQVAMRAEIEFYESNIHQTTGDTGILLFVSLMENRAVVLADKAIAEKLPPETWQEVCDLLVQGIKKGNMGRAFKDAIGKCGELLSTHFPIQPDDVNELKDQLIIKE